MPDRRVIYNYDRATGAFISQTEADWSPLEPGVPLIPSCATTTAPPETIPDGKLAVWDAVGDKWVLRTRAEVFPPAPSVPAPSGNAAWVPPKNLGTSPTASVTPGDEISEEKALQSFVQTNLDARAKSMGYDSIASAISYVGDDNPQFDLEARSLKSWRSKVWTACYALQAQVMNGTAEVVPTKANIMGLLPQFELLEA